MNTHTQPLALIVEDDLSSAKLYERLLAFVGYRSAVCTNFQETLTYLAENVPDLLVLDMRLDQQNAGPDILRHVRYQERYKNTRVVIITAYSTMIEKFGDMADMVVLKPLNARELMIYAEEELLA